MKNKEESKIINSEYTFENFVVDSSNEIAYNVALSVTKNVGKTYNPLFIYGNTGFGKTHLIHAIENKVKETRSVVCVTGEQFIYEYIQSIVEKKDKESFRKKYRQCDLLLIDDIQFISGKEETQAELFHIFNDLNIKNKQIVMTSDRIPSKIAGLAGSLKSRFEWGLVIDIQAPELKIKTTIIKQLFEIYAIELSKDNIDILASNTSSINEIKSILLSIKAYTDLAQRYMSSNFARDLIEKRTKNN